MLNSIHFQQEYFFCDLSAIMVRLFFERRYQIVEIKDQHWKIIRELFNTSYNTTFHFSLGTVAVDGSPHITPIGSMILRDDKTGFYFEGFSQEIPKNVKLNHRVCVMAVNTGKLFWLKSIIKGRFRTPPGVRLYGKAGEKRKSPADEMAKWQKRIKSLRKFKGYDLLWGDLKYVRDISSRRF
jgi:uncharacterized protein